MTKESRKYTNYFLSGSQSLDHILASHKVQRFNQKMIHCHSDVFTETEEIIITEEWFLNQTICGEELVDICCTKFADVYHDIHTCTLYIYI